MSDESSDASGTSDGASTLVWAVVGALGALAALEGHRHAERG